VCSTEPRWGRSGSRPHVDGYTVFVHKITDIVEPAEVPDIIGSFEESPREDTDRYDIDASFLHQLDILLPNFSIPLFWIVVGTVVQLVVVSLGELVGTDGLHGDGVLKGESRDCSFDVQKVAGN